MNWRRVGLALLVIPAVSAGCGSAGVSPLPAGPTPSAIATMICQPKAQTEIGEALGQDTTKVTTPTWNDHLYTCDYDYPQGVITLSVKELSSQAETTAYFQQEAARFGDKQQLFGLGQGAFLTTNGSVVARKDWKVLVVDTTGVSGSFASSRSLSGTPAETIASVIMQCWNGD